MISKKYFLTRSLSALRKWIDRQKQYLGLKFSEHIAHLKTGLINISVSYARGDNMEFCVGYDNAVRKKIIDQVTEECIPECIPSESIERIEVYLGETCNTISVYLSDSIIEIPNVIFDGIWGIEQWDTAEFHMRRDV